MDGIEAITNATVGVLVSALAVWLLWPLFGWSANGAQSFAVVGFFWAISTVRSYAVRKVFRWLS